MKYVALISSILLFANCNTSTNSETASDSSAMKDSGGPGNMQASLQDGCYRKITGRDTLLLKLQVSGNNVSGSMKFDNYEKDSSHGTVAGSQDGDIISLWYTFQAEGTTSYMQQAFKKTDGGLILGTANMDYKNDSVFIKDKNSLSFTNDNLLAPVDCSAIEPQLNAGR